MNYMITYQKNNGDIFFRARNSLLGLSIGDETSMGWKVLDIHYLYEGNYYTYDDYKRVRHGKEIKKKEKHKFIKFIINQLNKLI